jgi:hypothetical protein
MSIVYCKHKDIDKVKWDKCISAAENRIIYALSWYLDIVSPGWDGIILGDYEIVMPLTWKSKIGIKYIYKPLFVQQLGIFGKNITAELTLLITEQIPSQFKIIHIQLNELNTVEKTKFKITSNNNFKLNLQNTFQNIQEQYNRNCNRNIKKSINAGYSFTTKVSISDFSNLLVEQMKSQADKFGTKELVQYTNLVTYVTKESKGEIVGVIDKDEKLVAAGLYLFSFERLIFLICGSTEQGKVNQAMYLLVNEQIKRYAGKFEWYDFSGSNIKGIAYFNSTFGAKPTEYYSIYINRLSLPMKIITGKF